MCLDMNCRPGFPDCICTSALEHCSARPRKTHRDRLGAESPGEANRSLLDNSWLGRNFLLT